MKSVTVQITAYDKNTSEHQGKTIMASSKESLNKQVKLFEDSLPYRRYYLEFQCTDGDENSPILEDIELS
jgi:hypothetical protein